MSKFDDTTLNVIRWAEARQIIPNSTPEAQATKTVEEAGELLEAASALKACDDLAKLFHGLLEESSFRLYRKKCLDKFKDAVGDVLVTLVNGCVLADVDMVDCMAGAYEEIKDRKGHMNKEGVFVKDEA